MSEAQVRNKPIPKPFLKDTTCTAQQKDGVCRVFSFGDTLGEKVTILQAPLKAEKAHTIVTRLLYLLQQEYTLLVTATSNLGNN